MEKYLKIISIAFIITVSAVLIFGGLTTGHDWGGDFASYIMQAKSIVGGQVSEFIEENSFTINESPTGLGPVAYPWGFSLMLAPFFAIFGLNIYALKFVVFICFLLFLLVLWWGFRKYHSHYWLIILISLFAFNPIFILYVNNILSDIPFLLVSTLSILLIGRLVIEKQKFISPFFDPILLGILIAYAYFIRTNGILLLITLLVTQFFTSTNLFTKLSFKDSIKSFSLKKVGLRNSAIAVLPYISFMVMLLIWSIFFPQGSSSYTDILSLVSIESIIQNIRNYLTLPANFFYIPSEFLFNHVRIIIYIAGVPAVILGIFNRYKKDYHIIIYIILNFLLLLIWPVKATTVASTIRYIFPIFPFLASFALTPIERFDRNKKIQWKFKKILSGFPILIIVLLFILYSASYSAGNYKNNRICPYGPYTEASTEMFSFIQDETEPSDVIIFFKPRVMGMITDRSSFEAEGPEEIYKGDYLILYAYNDTTYPIPLDDLEYLISDNSIQEVFHNQEFLVYKVNKQV